MSAILNSVLAALRLLVKWGLLATVVGIIVAVPYLYRQVDEQIRREVEEKVTEHYRRAKANLRVTVRSAALVEGEGIEIRDLSILEAGADGPRAELIHVEEVFVRCRGDLEELLSGQLQVSRIWLRRPTLRLTKRADGSWSAGKLLPLPRFSQRPPEMVIENGTIEVFDPTKSPAGTLTLRDVNLNVSAANQVTEPGVDQPPRDIQGTFAGDYVGQVRLSGRVDPAEGSFSVEGHSEGLEISPDLRGALPGEAADRLAVLGAFRGRGDIEFRVGYYPRSEVPYRFEVAGNLAQGRIDDPRLPQPWTDMKGAFRLDNSGFVIQNLFAKSGQSRLWIKSWRQAGYDKTSPLWLEAELRHLELGWDLVDFLPDPLRKQWPKYTPTGTVHADLKLAYDGRTWQPQVSVQCLNLSFSYSKFPYRLQHTRGTVNLQDDVLKWNLVGYSSGQAVQVSGEVIQPMAKPAGWVEIRGEGLPLDEKLFDALQEKHQRLVRELAPRGTMDVFFEFRNEGPGQPPRRNLQIDLNRCSMRYERFPYPLSNIRGTLQLIDDRWIFSNLEGTNDTGRVFCRGGVVPTSEGIRLELHLTAKTVSLEEELRDALTGQTMRQLWNDLRLQGMIDLEATVHYQTGWPKPTVTFRAEPHAEKTSVQPIRFPYRLADIRGAIVYRDGHVTLEEFKARHGDTTLSGAACCTFRPDGSWQLDLEGLSVDRLRFDRDLTQALPGGLRKAVDQLRPGGPVYLRGDLKLGRGGLSSDPISSSWNVEIGLFQGSIDFGVKIENIHGDVRLVGGFDGEHFRSRGELTIDSVTHRDVQFTKIRGPIWINDGRVLLGSWAESQGNRGPLKAQVDKRRKPRRLTAELFGGTVYADASVSLGSAPQYWIKATLADGDLSRTAQELVPGRQSLRGSILASVDLRGTGRSLNSLAGLGTIRLRDADIYELPLMIALLKILSIKEPDSTAFSESDIQFRVEGGHIYLDSIGFQGDAISLEGVGDMNFDTAIDLHFRARLGRNKLNLPVIREILGGASEQIMVIHVSGTLGDPETRKEAFPGVNHALQQLQADLQKSTMTGDQLLRTGRWPPNGASRLPRKR